MKDGFCDTLKLVSEFGGIQHYEYPNPFHQTYKQLESQRRRDEIKNFKCKISGVTFLGIEYHVQNRIKKQRTEEGKFHLRSCF